MSVLELLSENYGHPVEYFEGDTFDINLFKIEELFERKSYYEHMQDFYLKYEKKNPYLKLSLMYFDTRLTYINHCLNQVEPILNKMEFLLICTIISFHVI